MKSKKKLKSAPRSLIQHTLGDKHFIEGNECVVRFINNGTAWISPTTDDEDAPLIRVGLAFARINEYGDITLL